MAIFASDALLEEKKQEQKEKGQEQSVLTVYSQNEVRTFWRSTTDEVKRTVKRVAKLNREDHISKDVYKKLSKSERKYLEGASAADLENVMQMYLDRAGQRKTIMENSSQKTVRAERGTSSFLNSFHGYVQAYSGVVQIMNGAGPGYGDAAYGALSLFLVVAVNKHKMEELIESCLLTLQQQYCRIQMIKDIYATDRMKEHTAVVYRLGIEFLYEAVRYYSIGPFRRFWHIVAQPPNVVLEKKVSEIQAAIGEMRKEMEVLDGIRLKVVEQKLSAVAQTAGDIERSVEALRTRNDNDRLEVLRSLLRLSEDELDIALDGYSDLLGQTFDNLKKYPGFDVDKHLFASAAFQEWRRMPTSRLMMVHGTTLAPDPTHLCWLSPAAVRLVSEFEEHFPANATTMICYFCRTSDDPDTGQQRASPVTVLSSVVFQLIRSDGCRGLLRDEILFTGLRRSLEALAAIPASRLTQRVDKLYSILEGALADLGLENLVIVIDRLDQIQGDMDRLLDPLLDLMGKRRCNIKTFATLRHRYPLEEDHIRERLGDDGFVSLEFNQDC